VDDLRLARAVARRTSPREEPGASSKATSPKPSESGNARHWADRLAFGPPHGAAAANVIAPLTFPSCSWPSTQRPARGDAPARLPDTLVRLLLSPLRVHPGRPLRRADGGTDLRATSIPASQTAGADGPLRDGCLPPARRAMARRSRRRWSTSASDWRSACTSSAACRAPSSRPARTHDRRGVGLVGIWIALRTARRAVQSQFRSSSSSSHSSMTCLEPDRGRLFRIAATINPVVVT